MSDELLRNHKLADALPKSPGRGPAHPGAAPGQTPEAGPEQQREAQEDLGARHAQGEVRDRLVDIGKAHHMAGRGNGRVSDA
jgi:hypothetical protein